MIRNIALAILIMVIISVPAFGQGGGYKTDITGYAIFELKSDVSDLDPSLFEMVDFREVSDPISDEMPLLEMDQPWGRFSPSVLVYSNQAVVQRENGDPDMLIFVREGKVVAIDATFGFVPADELEVEDEGSDDEEEEEGMSLDDLKDMVVGIIVSSYHADLRVDAPEGLTVITEVLDMFEDDEGDVLIVHEYLGTHVTYMTGEFMEEFFIGEEE